MDFLRRLFGKKSTEPPERTFMGKRVVDLRSDKERRIEEDALAGKSLGRRADALVKELIQIGRAAGFVPEIGDDASKRRKQARAREIGEALNDMGGMELMQGACYRVRSELGAGEARALEHAWEGIGDWQS